MVVNPSRSSMLFCQVDKGINENAAPPLLFELARALWGEDDQVSGADIAHVCQQAKLRALHENIDVQRLCWRHFFPYRQAVTSS
jgi:SpoVK/Ycf46/Vps4 family AAA+-type ATPase